MRRRFQRLIVTSGNKVGRVRTDRFGYTIETLFWTLLSSAPIPLLLLTTGFLLSSAPESTEFAKATARALTRISPDMLILLFFLDTTLVGGLLLKHFRWPTNVVNKLRSEYKLLILLFLPLAFVAIHSISLDTLLKVSSGGGLGLITVVAAIGSIALFIYRMFTPNGGVLAEYLAYRSERLLNRFRKLWVGLLVTAVIGLIVLVLIGYLYTGATLTRDLINTIWLINLLILAHALAIRWLIIISRRLAYQAAIERRDEARAAREAAATREQDSHSTSMEDSIEIEEPVVDLKVLDSESRKLVNTALLFAGIVGLWLIWAPVLPAFGILDDIALWNRTAMVDGVETLSPVTLADLALALIIGIITAGAAKGLPAFLEFILLERLSMTAGGRYTATTLLRYVIVGIGVVIFFNILGGSWSQIQWLVAALGVGIGFGLQEIVANFISGLIILFERPIRVGDTVTVGETSGVVSRIQIRATTITNWDRQELLVPNKEFITNQLLNWSLSDPIIRIKISVGIAYGSDVSKAMILMKEAADENKNVLKDPASSVTFESFGDNALGLFLVAFLPSIENRIRTITELHQAINDKFNDAGIVISFPQRDVHLDTSNPLDIRIHQAEP
jgi:potassium efflux system protein